MHLMQLRHSLVAGTILAATAALTALPTSSSTAGPAPRVSAPSVHTAEVRHDARAAADALVAARAPKLLLSRYDRVHASATLRSGPLSFVPYERTYRGLPVVGGDFVVVVKDGEVVYTSVAQTAKVTLSDVRASVPAAAARTVAVGKVRDAHPGRSTLVVLQRGDRSTLAWRTTVTGTKAGQPSRLEVYVDARTGGVVQTRERVLQGDGNSAYSGPNPVAISTRATGSGFAMTTNAAPSLNCQNLNTGLTITGPDDHWGNGNATNIETGCVDALYAAQQERAMLKAWLGREGMNGNDGWVPLRVGLDDLNAFYDGTQVQIGHNTANGWIGSLDVTAHEFAHGIDDHTPGGISGQGTQEFVADTFGAATEAYDNQPSPFDVPDYAVGEEINLVGSGPIRVMYQPSLVGDPNCYSASIPDDEVHAAAGPGDHWFYLLAEGSNPGGGKPSSPTCNGSSISGIGIQKAMKIMYTAMLMKNSSSSYLSYRAWTLTAAKYLYGTSSSCTEYNTVRAAWNAVSVPVGAGEWTCSTSNKAVKVTSTIDHTVAAGTTITPFSMTATGGTAPYTWTAARLPKGLTISSAGQISGTLATDAAGVYPAQVIATDTKGLVGRGFFNIAVSGARNTGCSGQRLGNPGFENLLPAPWTHGAGEVQSGGAHSGANFDWLGGWGEEATSYASQDVFIPAGCRGRLVFWMRIETDDSTIVPFDFLTVKAKSTTLKVLSNLDANDTWTKFAVNLPTAYNGAVYTISFLSEEDISDATSFKLDDVAVTPVTP